MEIIYREGWEPQKRAALDAMGRKYCKKCDTWKELTEFYLVGRAWVKINGVWWGKPQSTCIACRKEYARGNKALSEVPDNSPVARVSNEERSSGPSVRRGRPTEALPTNREATDEELLQPPLTLAILESMLETGDVTDADIRRFRELRPDEA